jgi:hypothetical protein
MWIGSCFLGGRVVAPRATRWTASTFAAVAASDFVELVYGPSASAAQTP